MEVITVLEPKASPDTKGHPRAIKHAPSRPSLIRLAVQEVDILTW